MENPSDYRIANLGQLRTIIGEPSPMVAHKLLTALDELAIDFIRRSPSWC